MRCSCGDLSTKRITKNVYPCQAAAGCDSEGAAKKSIKDAIASVKTQKAAAACTLQRAKALETVKAKGTKRMLDK